MDTFDIFGWIAWAILVVIWLTVEARWAASLTAILTTLTHKELISMLNKQHGGLLFRSLIRKEIQRRDKESY